jgi:diaminohydroxyphosphoribosylaminopyrimidine deaminase / 5-amino-6-(5-phosphoribosylamino)uracil reductase
LRKALALAEGGRGRVSPNPLVGALVVRDGEVIGEGFHAELGGLHAERAALADSAARGEDVRGATMYVTLEPCAHQGRQPPCADGVLEAGIARVVIASDDPTTKAAGKGPERMRDGGVEVEFTGDAEIERDARLLNQPFRKHGATRLPWVLFKTAMSIDGRTQTPPGTSPWISGEASRALVHTWRGELDAIAVGIGTVLADDPLLTARPGGAERPAGGFEDTDLPRQPVRVVFDSVARLPLDSRLLATTDEAPVLVVTGPDADLGRLAAIRDAGAETIVAAGTTSAERIEAALRELGARGLTSLLLEGGATLAAAFAAAGQIDEARVFVAPLLLGGPGPEAPATRLEGAAAEPEAVGEDTLIRTRFKEW